MADSMDEVRINKYIAMCGICSRRDADRIIDAGRVTVNDVMAVSGTKVRAGDRVLFDGRPVSPVPEKVVLAFCKPVGVTCTERDEHALKTVSDVLHYPIRLNYAGRLDKDTDGLLLMTNDGDLIEDLMRGKNGHEKEYVVTLKSAISDEAVESMARGIYLEELDVVTRPCKIEKIDDKTLRIILTQGLNRQIKRMCDAVGNRVIALRRVRVANIKLGDLKPGQYREIKGAELKELYDTAKGKR